ncbi:MAG: class II histone deacetylase [Burkholderiaceae bacterium]|nr:class II histone deacetylase [Burkholderiaceae bacterium]
MTTDARRKIGLVWHERYMWHMPGPNAGPLKPIGWVEPGEHIDGPQAKRRFKNLLDASGLTDQMVPIRPRPATLDELLRVHTPGYVDAVKLISDEGGGEIGLGANLGADGFDIAALAAGGAIAAVDAVLSGDVHHAYALIRPSGHHAEPGEAMGFCIFSNVAIAAAHALSARGIERVAVLDWDVHHGNGTQSAFYKSNRVLTISLHQDGVYPRGRGGIDERGEGAGEGYNINVPLPPGCGWEAYRAALDEIVVPALRAYKPQLMLVACGYDAGIHDPLGRMMLGPEAFRDMTEGIRALAEELCGGHLVLCQEGGYSPHSVPFLGVAVIEALMGTRTSICDLLEANLASMPGQSLYAHQREAIELARNAAEAAPWRQQARTGR